MNNHKRVYCLYRVSTKGQVEKNDIPMQRQRCREFAEQMGWNIVREFTEKGVSGFKVSANDRDAIIEIKSAAERGEFDVLLVFMFDRIGRKDDETPFVVKWLAEKGIEVWSTVEGQQRFKSHVDDLINYLHFWQASGESQKTSVRTKTRLGQIVQEGKFRGGICPYGYKLVRNGRKNRRNNEVYDIEIDEDEAAIVKLIFSKYVNEGYGAQRLSKYLAEQNIMTRDGRRFTNTTLNHMLKNVLYTGVLRSGEIFSEIFPHLQIITPEMFERAAQIMTNRTQHKSGTPLSTKGEALLTGLLYCADCGRKIIRTASGGKGRKPRERYQCHHRVRHPDECHNQSAFNMERLDGIVEQAVLILFDNMGTVSADTIIENRYNKETKLAEARVRKLTVECDEAQKNVDIYKSEVAKCLRGISKWDSALLRELLEEAQTILQKTEAELQQAQTELDNCAARMEQIKNQHDELICWSKVFAKSSTAAKKMILSKLIERIEVSRGYEVNICFRISYAQFCGAVEEDVSPVETAV